MEQQILDGMYEQLGLSKEVLDYAAARSDGMMSIDRKASINTAVGIQEDTLCTAWGKNTLGKKPPAAKWLTVVTKNRSRTPPGRLPDSRKSPLQKAAADRSVNTDKAMIFANSKDNRCFTGIWSITTAALTPGRVMQKSRKLNPRIRPAVLIPGPIPAPSRLSLIPLFHGRRKPATDNTEKSKTSTLALIP